MEATSAGRNDGPSENCHNKPRTYFEKKRLRRENQGVMCRSTFVWQFPQIFQEAFLKNEDMHTMCIGPGGMDKRYTAANAGQTWRMGPTAQTTVLDMHLLTVARRRCDRRNFVKSFFETLAWLPLWCKTTARLPLLPPNTQAFLTPPKPCGMQTKIRGSTSAPCVRAQIRLVKFGSRYDGSWARFCETKFFTGTDYMLNAEN